MTFRNILIFLTTVISFQVLYVIKVQQRQNEFRALNVESHYVSAETSIDKTNNNSSNNNNNGNSSSSGSKSISVGNDSSVAGADKKNLLLEELTFIQRREHLNKMCRLYRGLYIDSLRSTGELNHILVDEKHRLLYCYVPKVACTNWKRVLMVLTGQSEESNVSSIPSSLVHKKGVFRRLSEYPVKDVQFLISNYTKYLFVRHPFERLLSAYKNKLEDQSINSRYFQLRIGKQIVKKYKVNATDHSIKYGDDVTFEEFVTYLTEHHVSTYNEHWKPISNLCYPCLIKYDLIGKYETLYADSEFILNYINETRIKFPRVKSSNTTRQISEYYRPVPDNLIAHLYNIFILDFKLFNYKAADILGYDIG